MNWRLANSLIHLRDQINAAHPRRSKGSDGTIGDARHQAERSSDHNPWIIDGKLGVVSAIDITHDPVYCSGQKLADALIASRDLRIKYVIWNRRICSSIVAPWVWRKYYGSSPHTEHVHLSVRSDKPHYDDAHNWRIA